jgi:hypothetical protein
MNPSVFRPAGPLDPIDQIIPLYLKVVRMH